MYQKTLNLFGIEAEDSLILLSGVVDRFDIDIKTTKHLGGFDTLKISSNNKKCIDGFIKEIDTFLFGRVIDSENVVEYIVNRLKDKNQTITFAESCTGGLLASIFTKVAGVSAVFNGSFVVYSNDIKSKLLGVDKQLIDNYGAVSSYVANDMAYKAKKKLNATYSIAISGIAGPSGGTVEKPVGTVYISVATPNGIFNERLFLKGSREHIQLLSAYNAIRLFIENFEHS